MQRPTIADLALAAEVSVSTVDRVLNGREPVRPATAQRVLAAAEAIGFYGTGAIRQRLGRDKPERTFAFVLLQRPRPFYQLLADALTEATRASTAVRGHPVISFMDDLTPAAVADRLAKLAKSVHAIAVVTADHPHVTQAIDRLNSDGVPVFALISDLTAQGRAGYIGLDNLKVGRTAAWAITNLCKHPGKIGIFVGSHRYLCQDLCEMGFRSYVREHAADFHVLEARTSLEEARYAYETTLDLLKRNQDLVGLYVAGGGIRGVMRALRDEGPGVFRQLVTVCHDLMDETRSGLIDGVLKLVLAHPIKRLAEGAVTAMVRATEGSLREPFTQCLLPFDIYTAENV